MPDESSSLKSFLVLIETQLDVTEPAALDDDCAVASLAPTEKGLVGLDVNTGRPVQVGWKYKDILEKPVIINAGSKQTVILPKPNLSSLLPPAPSVTVAAASALYEAVADRFQPTEYRTEPDIKAKSIFVKGCLGNPDFFLKWQARLAVMETADKFVDGPPRDWPPPPRVRQRIVDT